MKRCCTSALCTQIVVSFAVSLMQLMGGVIFGYPGIVLPSLTDPESGDIYLDSEQVPFFTSIMLIGTMASGLISGPISVRFGQRVTMLISLPVGIVGWLICYFSTAYWQLLLSRLILGFFGAICFTNTNPFIAETVHYSLRGRLTALGCICRQLGIMFVYLVGSSSLDWRTVGLVCGLTPAVIPCIVLLFIPNSPRWAAVKGRSEKEVIKSLQFFREKNHDLEAEYIEIKEEIQKMNNSSTTRQQLKLLKERSIAKLMIFLSYFHFAFALCGNNLVSAYSASIFQSTGADISVYMSTIFTGFVRVFGVLVYICIADSFGRRPIFMIFCSLATLSMGALGLFFYLKHIGYDTSPIYWLPLASLICFTFFTNLYNPIIDLMRSELLPNSLRILGTNVIFAVISFGFFLSILTYPIISGSIGYHWAFWIYAINSLVMLVVMYFFLPETKGKSLEEIAKLF